MRAPTWLLAALLLTGLPTAQAQDADIVGLEDGVSGIRPLVTTFVQDGEKVTRVLDFLVARVGHSEEDLLGDWNVGFLEVPLLRLAAVFAKEEDGVRKFELGNLPQPLDSLLSLECSADHWRVGLGPLRLFSLEVAPDAICGSKSPTDPAKLP